MTRAWWPHNVLGRSLVAYAQAHRLSAMVAFLAATTDYAKVVRAVQWGAHGIAPAVLVSPNTGGKGGALRSVPQAAGEAFADFWCQELTPQWVSTGSLTLTAEAL